MLPKSGDGITVDLDLGSDWSQWQWMKYFRLWQANRKVFLYPENWIEPELLPDGDQVSVLSRSWKTIFCKMTSRRITLKPRSLVTWTSWMGVARLEIKAMWYDDFKKTLHVVGRTYGGDPQNLLLPDLRSETAAGRPGSRSTRTSPATTSCSPYSTIAFTCSGRYSVKNPRGDQATVPPLPGSSSSTSVNIDKPPKYLADSVGLHGIQERQVDAEESVQGRRHRHHHRTADLGD